MEIRKEDTQKEQLTLYRGRFRSRKKVIIFSSLISYFILGYFISNTYAQSSVAPSCQATGNIIKAASGKPGDLRHAIDKAQSGDTVLIPAGTFTFNDEITIKKGLHLQGAGRTETILKRTSGSTGFTEGMITFDCSGNMQVTVSDIQFKGFGGSGRGPAHNGLVLLDCKNLRVHNSHFEAFWNAGVRVDGIVTGVIDHSNFINNFMAQGSGSTYGYGVATGGAGRYYWDRPLELGTADAIYVENNFFRGNKHAVAAGQGVKYVARYNTVADSSQGLWQFDAHGNFNCNRVGTRSVEIYNNTINRGGNNIGIRGGAGVIFNNNLDGKIKLYNDCNDQYRIDDLYVWNNVKQIFDGKPSGVSTSAKPNYTPYTYPHPLTSCDDPSVSSPMLPPQQLRISTKP